MREGRRSCFGLDIGVEYGVEIMTPHPSSDDHQTQHWVHRSPPKVVIIRINRSLSVFATALGTLRVSSSCKSSFPSLPYRRDESLPTTASIEGR